MYPKKFIGENRLRRNLDLRKMISALSCMSDQPVIELQPDRWMQNRIWNIEDGTRTLVMRERKYGSDTAAFFERIYIQDPIIAYKIYDVIEELPEELQNFFIFNSDLFFPFELCEE